MQVVNLSLLTRDEFLNLIRSIEHLHFGGINCLLPHLNQFQNVVRLGLTSQVWLQVSFKFWLKKLLFGLEL